GWHDRDGAGANLGLLIARDDRTLALQNDERHVDARTVDRDVLPRLNARQHDLDALSLTQWHRREAPGLECRGLSVVTHDDWLHGRAPGAERLRTTSPMASAPLRHARRVEQ